MIIDHYIYNVRKSCICAHKWYIYIWCMKWWGFFAFWFTYKRGALYCNELWYNSHPRFRERISKLFKLLWKALIQSNAPNFDFPLFKTMNFTPSAYSKRPRKSCPFFYFMRKTPFNVWVKTSNFLFGKVGKIVTKKEKK